MMERTARLLVATAGLAGAAGVALAAAAAHLSGDPGLSGAALLLVLHAAAVVALTAHLAGGSFAPRLAALAGFALLVGAVLFAGDLAARAFLGGRLFPNAAPTGGTVMILGWLAVAAAALVGRRRP